MNYRASAVVLGILIVSCVYLPTQRSPFSEATTQFKVYKSTGTEVAETIRPYSAIFNTFNGHRYGVYQWTGQGIYIEPLKPFIAPLTCMSPVPVEKDRSPQDQFMLIEVDRNDLLVRYEVVSKMVPSRYLATLELKTEFRKRLLSEIWAIPSADLAVDIDPYQMYWHNTHQADAKKWLCEAADQHNPEALYRLGTLYENGSEDLPKNMEIAYFWYRLGAKTEAPWWLNFHASQTNDWSALAAKRIEGELTPEQRGDVEDRIRAWRPRECNQLLMRDSVRH